MSKEILLVVDSVSNEKGVPPDVIFEAIEMALAAATKKRYEYELDIRVSIDRKTGEHTTFRRWHVVEDQDFTFAGMHLTWDEGQEKDTNLNVGDVWEEVIESVPFGRIAAQLAKQVIVQKVREAERQQVVDRYRDRVGELVSGTVKKVNYSNIIVDLGGNADAFLAKDQILPRESYRVGMRIRAILQEIASENKGPQLVLSRVCPQMLTELFRIEVPEIAEDVIHVRSTARDPGSRAKIAVKTNDGRIDPIGACVGMCGARVQAVSDELDKERIDIVLWDDDPVQLVINAMRPAEVASLVVDEERYSMDIAVAEENLAQAIGRNGQNVRLASELTGWTLNVMSETAAEAKQEKESDRMTGFFVEALDIELSVANLLVSEGFTSLEEIAYIPEEEILAIEGIEASSMESLRAKAKDKLLTQAIAQEEQAEPAEDLRKMEGMDEALALQLAAAGIATQESLAEQSVDELLEIEGMDEARAAQLIMAARAPWFENDQNGSATEAGE